MRGLAFLLIIPGVAGADAASKAADSTPVSTLGWTVAAGFVGAILTQVIKHFYDKRESRRSRRRQAEALQVEIDYCARLARTYTTEGYSAPLYRFPDAVFKAVFPQLATGALKPTGIDALTSFFSLVDQMNRGLDAVDRFRAAGEVPNAQDEINRLLLKAAQMQHPMEASREPGQNLKYYAGAKEALKQVS